LSYQSDLPAFVRHRRVNLKIGLIPEDDLPRMAKSRKMTYQEMAKSQKMTYRDWPYLGFQRGRVIPDCRKLDFRGLKNAGKKSLEKSHDIKKIVKAIQITMHIQYTRLCGFTYFSHNKPYSPADVTF
jgi:hypothetical protein